MAFNSSAYLVFFVVIWLVVRAATGFSLLRVWVLLFASWYYYASNNHWILLLLLVTTQIDYMAAIAIEDAPTLAVKKRWLTLSLVANLGMLASFKYLDFFGSSAAWLAHGLGLSLSWTDLHIVLPAGISFYTFESMSYTIDVYRGHLRAERSWPRYAMFVAYFPHLVAGPIVRPAVFLPQIDAKQRLRADEFQAGLFLIFQGLLKKIVLADFLAPFADSAFDKPAEAGLFAAALGTYAFALQIYFDFSGYTDLAIGCSKLMGFQLPENFRRPYAAMSMTDFWRRWHISLSTWLRDYLYVPLGGNRMGSEWGVYRNLMITMLLGGLWHGAAWHFVLWGGLQGAFLVLERHFGVGRRPGSGIAGTWQWTSRAIAFHLTCFCWIFFRAADGTALREFFAAFLRTDVPMTVTAGTVVAAVIVAGGIILQQVGERWDLERLFVRLPIPVQAAAFAAIGVLVVVIGSGPDRPFIYFQF
jgi:alginate O-acetyltransferase complex protein AlgI